MKVNDKVSTPEGDGIVVGLGSDPEMFQDEEGPSILVQLDSGDALYFYSDEIDVRS